MEFSEPLRTGHWFLSIFIHARAGLISGVWVQLVLFALASQTNVDPFHFKLAFPCYVNAYNASFSTHTLTLLHERE